MDYAFLATFSDVAYDLSRTLLRLSSVLFLAYVLTVFAVLILTWRPRSRTRTVTIGETAAPPVPRAVERPSVRQLIPAPAKPASLVDRECVVAREEAL